MSVELRPLGVACNIACSYCYQHPQRDAEINKRHYDIDKMKEAILKEGGPFSIFGGEPLLVPIEDLENLFSWGLDQFGQNAIQTNGTLITEEHIQLFKKYNVSVGLSVDGPKELNDVRWSRSLVNTRKQTQKTHDSITLLVKEGIVPGLIVTLHTGNATAEKLSRMSSWFRELDTLGIKSARLHLLEVDNELVGKKYRLSVQENIDAMIHFHQLEKELNHMRFDMFREIENLLKGNDTTASCVWKACDPYTTSAVRGVEGDGRRSNCGRTNKEGIDFLKADMPSYVRYIALYNTPQEKNGCQDCRFFAMCKGHCPGTSLEGDWRNRTEHCEVWKTLFTIKEKEMLERGEMPLSKHEALPYIEEQLIAHWRTDTNTSIQEILKNNIIAQLASHKNETE